MDRIALVSRKSRPVMEGAGVHLKRAFGFGNPSESDPFLLLDDFRSSKPSDYIAGFPWHPHRGIETITYVLNGKIEHQDSMGNRGVIGPGDVQWMTAGRGIIHQEMPASTDSTLMEGFQLWANLPASRKMMKPRYQEIKASEIPDRVMEDGSRIHVICGSWENTTGPVEDIITDPDYLDITLAPGADLYHAIPAGKNAFSYVISGRGRFGEGPEVDNETLTFFGDGTRLRLRASPQEPFRFLLCTGLGLGEPVAWHGPIVMNTNGELEEAFRQLDQGTFLD